MNPADYAFYTLNAKQLLIEPEYLIPVKPKENKVTTGRTFAIFALGVIVGLLIN